MNELLLHTGYWLSTLFIGTTDDVCHSNASGYLVIKKKIHSFTYVINLTDTGMSNLGAINSTDTETAHSRTCNS